MTGGLPPAVARLLGDAAPISLEELQATAALRTRVDRKYVVDWDTLTTVLEQLSTTHRALDIGGERLFRYESVYFDTADLSAFRAHMQRRRRRYKVRTRHYVGSGLRVFEVKLKGKRGQTVKHQMPYASEDLARVSPDARAFLADRLAEAYPRMVVPPLQPTLRNRYQRLTLACGAERVTCDFDLTFGAGDQDVPGLDERFAIVESKCEGGLGAVDRLLRGLGVQPVACSKYCVGVGLLRDDVKVNELRWLLRRYFRAGDPARRPALAGSPVNV